MFVWVSSRFQPNSQKGLEGGFADHQLPLGVNECGLVVLIPHNPNQNQDTDVPDTEYMNKSSFSRAHHVLRDRRVILQVLIQESIKITRTGDVGNPAKLLKLLMC